MGRWLVLFAVASIGSAHAQSFRDCPTICPEMVTIPAGSASLGPASGEEEREGIPAASRQGEPRSPWQRGSNENTNGLVRQYFPSGTNFARISQAHLNAIALRLNQRPRKTLGFETPADKLRTVLH